MEPEEMAKMEPSKVASDLMDELINYCVNAFDYYECMANAMEGLDKVIYDYLIPSGYRVNPEIEEAINNSDTFRDEVEKEFKEMLNDFWARTLAVELNNVLKSQYEEITDNNALSNSCKARLLKAYEKALEEFRDAIKRALQERKPLSKKDLYNWFTELGDIVFGGKEPDYDVSPDFVLDYYDMLDDNGKLEMLSFSLYYIDDMLHYIKQKLSELEALTNKS
jgi:hypothetical protein